jgi:uncharacterized membrane-anchored protein
MTPRRRLAFWALVAVQALVPLGLIASNEIALATGTKVTLGTVPVDPIDLFRGRYVRLRYEISSVPRPRGAEPGDRVYVALHREGTRWTGDTAVRERPGSGPFIRGTVSRSGITYGIETYYADEAEARRLEARAHRLHVHVALDDEGKARISGIEAVR